MLSIGSEKIKNIDSNDEMETSQLNDITSSFTEQMEDIGLNLPTQLQENNDNNTIDHFKTKLLKLSSQLYKNKQLPNIDQNNNDLLTIQIKDNLYNHFQSFVLQSMKYNQKEFLKTLN